MISQEKIVLSNGNETTKEKFAFDLLNELKTLYQYFRGYLDRAVKGLDVPISSLKPQDAAERLRSFYYTVTGAGSIGEYQKTMRSLNPFIEENPKIGIVIDVLSEKVGQLEEIAKKAPPETLKEMGLNYLIQPPSQ